MGWMNMDSSEYRAALATLGLSQRAAAELVGVNAVTARKWASNKKRVTRSGDPIHSGPPESIARYLNFLVSLRRMIHVALGGLNLPQKEIEEFLGGGIGSARRKSRLIKYAKIILPGTPESVAKYMKHLIALREMLP
jgi:hypothetical protein